MIASLLLHMTWEREAAGAAACSAVAVAGTDMHKSRSALVSRVLLGVELVPARIALQMVLRGVLAGPQGSVSRW